MGLLGPTRLPLLLIVRSIQLQLLTQRGLAREDQRDRSGPLAVEVVQFAMDRDLALVRPAKAVFVAHFTTLAELAP